MQKKIYVGNLSQKTTAEQITVLFSKAGKVVSTTIAMDKNATNRHMGHALVVMTTDDETLKAIKTLNGLLVDGNRIVVKEAHMLDQEKRRYTYRRW
ncbi:MAG: RNA-binding protein [bacterium]|nr:RNA-binding protein [bacterium]